MVSHRSGPSFSSSSQLEDSQPRFETASIQVLWQKESIKKNINKYIWHILELLHIASLVQPEGMPFKMVSGAIQGDPHGLTKFLFKCIGCQQTWNRIIGLLHLPKPIAYSLKVTLMPFPKNLPCGCFPNWASQQALLLSVKLDKHL